MDRKDYEALLVVIEHTIETSVSRGGGAFPGIPPGYHSHGIARLEKTAQKHNRPYNSSDLDSGDPYLDAISRLNRDCCKHIKPEDI